MTEGGKIPVNFLVSDFVTDIGSKLTIDLPTKTSGELKISIQYETSPKASGLQWLTPENTMGKKYPYMYSQCQVKKKHFNTNEIKDLFNFTKLTSVKTCESDRIGNI